MYGLCNCQPVYMPVSTLAVGVDFEINPNARMTNGRLTGICRGWARRNQHMRGSHQPHTASKAPRSHQVSVPL